MLCAKKIKSQCFPNDLCHKSVKSPCFPNDLRENSQKSLCFPNDLAGLTQCSSAHKSTVAEHLASKRSNKPLRRWVLWLLSMLVWFGCGLTLNKQFLGHHLLTEPPSRIGSKHGSRMVPSRPNPGWCGQTNQLQAKNSPISCSRNPVILQEPLPRPPLGLQHQRLLMRPQRPQQVLLRAREQDHRIKNH